MCPLVFDRGTGEILGEGSQVFGEGDFGVGLGVIDELDGDSGFLEKLCVIGEVFLGIMAVLIGFHQEFALKDLGCFGGPEGISVKGFEDFAIGRGLFDSISQAVGGDSAAGLPCGVQAALQQVCAAQGACGILYGDIATVCRQGIQAFQYRGHSSISTGDDLDLAGQRGQVPVKQQLKFILAVFGDYEQAGSRGAAVQKIFQAMAEDREVVQHLKQLVAFAEAGGRTSCRDDQTQLVKEIHFFKQRKNTKRHKNFLG